MPTSTDLSRFSNPEFDRGASRFKELAWMVVSALFFRHSLAVGNGLKVWWLRRFGAQLGRGVFLKPSVQIKFPWKLTVGDYVWIGEGVWIDNLAPVRLGDHVCLSQGALLLTGNHDYTTPTFDLLTRPITLENGVWIGARALVAPGVTAHSHAVLALQSVAIRDLKAYGIYQGNPAQWKKERKLS